MDENSLDSTLELLEDLDKQAHEQYNQYFKSYFDLVFSLYKRLNSESRPITDNELESILIDLPLNLVQVSELVNRFRLQREVVKIKLKYNKDNKDFDAMNHAIFLQLNDTIITRVENELSFSRELIMSAKKVWDSRRQAESAVPIDPVDTVPKYYVK